MRPPLHSVQSVSRWLIAKIADGGQIRMKALVLFLSLRFLLVLSCLGQAADLVVSITRSSAVGIMLTPPKLERVPTWGSA